MAKNKYLAADTAAIQLFELTFLRNWFFVLPAVARGRATSKGGFPLRRFGMHASRRLTASRQVRKRRQGAALRKFYVINQSSCIRYRNHV